MNFHSHEGNSLCDRKMREFILQMKELFLCGLKLVYEGDEVVIVKRKGVIFGRNKLVKVMDIDDP